MNRELANESIECRLHDQYPQYRVVSKPFEGKDIFETLKVKHCEALTFTSPEPSETAYFHHTTGTSGTPKPIAQSHYGAVGALF